MPLFNASFPRVMSSFALSIVLAAGATVASLTLLPKHAHAQGGLPDFTELVEKSGPTVVNIRTTAQVRRGANSLGIPGLPDLDENDPLYEFFRRMIPPNRNAPESSE